MEKILDIIDMIAYEKGIEPQIVYDIVRNNIIRVAKEEINEAYDYFVEKDAKTRSLKLFYKVLVCADDDERLKVENPSFVGISKAKEAGEVAVGDILEYEISLDSMKRGAINKLFLNLEIGLQRQIEDQIFADLNSKLNHIVAGVVVGVDKEENTFVEISGIRAILAKKHRIKGESFKNGQTIRALLKFVGFARGGIKLELSRTAPKFLEELLTLEVPELKDGEIYIHKSARIPGARAKIAVYTNNARIDPIGCCVGVKGVRINAVSSELHGENIDCIEYTQSREMFIARALAPAQVLSVKIQKAQNDAQNTQAENLEKTSESKLKDKAIVQITSDQKSKAIGKSGINVRLASMLCDCEIELQEIGENAPRDALIQREQAQKIGIDALQSLFKS
ncbi:transcription termination factor NusA [Helicobacter himalayensis]|uniref:transcription termination factor NusA n=1 Tax=Helicobacter himalayensis TaxID=1591088 RepID=UPI00082DF389|nr:transcription termination factor NusA [Helicobacter himalayensis]